MSNESIKVAVVGLGYWGPNLVRNFIQTDGGEVTRVCDIVPERCARMQKLYPWVKATNRYEEILQAKDVDAVAIATPPSEHYAMARAALELGKHVLVAKPMTETMKDALELVAFSEKVHQILMVDHTFAYSSSVRMLKQFMSNNTLGDIYFFDSVRVNPWLSITKPHISVIRDLAAHDISIMVYLFDSVPKVTSIIAKDDGSGLIGLAYISLDVNDRVLGHIFVNRLSPLKIRRTMLGGSKGLVLYDDTETSDKVKLYEQSFQFNAFEEDPHTPTNRLGGVYIPVLEAREPLQVEAQHFVDSILRQTLPITGGEFGLKVVQVLTRCEELAQAQLQGGHS